MKSIILYDIIEAMDNAVGSLRQEQRSIIIGGLPDDPVETAMIVGPS